MKEKGVFLKKVRYKINYCCSSSIVTGFVISVFDVRFRKYYLIEFYKKVHLETIVVLVVESFSV